MTVTYRADAELPSYAFEWRDRDGNLIDLSASTFELKLINQATAVVGLTKTTGITGYASPTTPNAVAAWAAGELASCVAAGGVGTYQVHLTATASGADRHFRPGSEPLLKIVAAV
jgi:hypothetical protein